MYNAQSLYILTGKCHPQGTIQNIVIKKLNMLRFRSSNSLHRLPSTMCDTQVNNVRPRSHGSILLSIYKPKPGVRPKHGRRADLSNILYSWFWLRNTNVILRRILPCERRLEQQTRMQLLNYPQDYTQLFLTSWLPIYTLNEAIGLYSPMECKSVSYILQNYNI